MYRTRRNRGKERGKYSGKWKRDTMESSRARERERDTIFQRLPNEREGKDEMQMRRYKLRMDNAENTRRTHTAEENFLPIAAYIGSELMTKKGCYHGRHRRSIGFLLFHMFAPSSFSLVRFHTGKLIGQITHACDRCDHYDKHSAPRIRRDFPSFARVAGNPVHFLPFFPPLPARFSSLRARAAPLPTSCYYRRCCCCCCFYN